MATATTPTPDTAAGSAGAEDLQCLIVTPERTVVDERCQFVSVPLYDGQAGIAPLHAAMIGRLGYGEVRFNAGNKRVRYYVEGGFVQVARNVVAVLTTKAVPAEKLDAEAIRQQLDLAPPEGLQPGSEATAAYHRQQEQLRSQLRVAERQTSADH